MAPAGERRGADPDQDPRGAGAPRPCGGGDRAGAVPPRAMPHLPRDRAFDPALPPAGEADRGFRAGCDPHRHRGAAGHGGTQILQAQRPDLHHRLSHQIPRIHPRAHEAAAEMELCLHALVPWRLGRRDGGDRQPGEKPVGLGFREPEDLVARRGHRTLQAARQGHPRPAAPDLSLCRPRGGGQEHRSLPAAQTGRHQAGGGHRPRPGRLSRQIPRSRVRRLSGERPPRQLFRRRRRVRLPQPDRHLRPGAARGAGLGRAGGGLSGDRAHRHRGAASRSGRPARGPGRGDQERFGQIARSLPRAGAAVFLGCLHRPVPQQPRAAGQGEA